jgi:hypothetical protein
MDAGGSFLDGKAVETRSNMHEKTTCNRLPIETLWAKIDSALIGGYQQI